MNRKNQKLPEPIEDDQSEAGLNYDDDDRIDDDMSWYEDLIYDQWRENQILKDLPQR